MSYSTIAKGMSGLRKRLVQRWDKVGNANTALNAGCWNDKIKQQYYYGRASLVNKHHDYQASQGKISEPNGGIFAPREVGIWTGEIFYRLVFRPKGISDELLAQQGTSEWFGTPELFHEASMKAQRMSSSDMALFDRSGSDGVMLDLLRCYQGLGYKYQPNSSVIIKYGIKGPTVALAGKGKRAAPDYKDEMATIGVWQPSPQIMIPGVFDLKGVKDQAMTDSIVEVLDIKSPVGFMKLG